ncbi:capsular biosynthesis protein [Fusobacterium canifelinum]|uniref:Capsular biosynthesis protein n=1 Tax=Fusobacterium canifelinum TaxID=285729 RepID=A0ABX7CHM2_9FUSO|nr:capsular biosynthesis protein [Fusobacterium canifelinum]
MKESNFQITTDEILKTIIDYENKENLFSRKIRGVYFYKLIRVGLYNKILNIILGTKNAQDSMKNQTVVFNFLKTYISNLFNKDKKTFNILLFDTGRVFYNEGQKSSIYMFDIIKNLKNKNESFRIIYPWIAPNENRIFEAPPALKYFLQYIFLTLKFKLNQKLNFQKFDTAENKLIENCNKELCNLLEINPNLPLFDKTEIMREIEKFKIQYNYYYSYFKKKNIKEIYIICAYGKEGVVAAAKDLNIKAIEIQHGTITKYHLAYHYPTNQKIPYFPKYFYSFGKYWEEIVTFPKGTKLRVYGFPYLQNQLIKYKDVPEEKDQILFISQGHVGEKLLYKAIGFAQKNKNKKIVYRLHPGELRYSIRNYINILEKYTLNNFILEDCKEDLYKLIKESEYIFAVSSTAIYEALALGKDVGIINLPSYEEVIDLIRQSYVDFYEEKDINEIYISHFKNTDYNKFFNMEMEEGLC